MRKATNPNPNDILCPLCLENLTIPRSLPCLHTYCERCLGNYIRNSFKSSGQTYSFKCPTCEKDTFLPSSGMPDNDCAVHFPFDRILMSMLPEDKNKVNQLCQSCMKGGKQEPADNFCTNCREALCTTCVGIHNKGKLDHLLISTRNPNCPSDMAIGISEGIKCSRHIYRDLEYFCRPHQRVCCSECLFDDHGTCEEKLKLKKHRSALMKYKQTEHLAKNINDLVDYLDKRTEMNKTDILTIESESQRMVDQIDSLISLLQNTKSRVIQEREVLLERESLTLQKQTMHFRSLKVSLINSLKSYEEVCKYGENYECFVILHKVEDQIVNCEKILQSNYPEIRQVNSNLQFVSYFEALRSMDVSELAKVVVNENIQTAPPVPRIARRSPLQLTSVGSIQPKMVSSFSPFGRIKFNAIESLPGNKLMLVGTKGSKGFCNVIDLQSNNILASENLPSRPWDLCVIDKAVPLVAVTFPRMRTIQILSIKCAEREATISTVGSIETNARTFYGVSALSPYKLVMSGETEDKICWSIVPIAEGNVEKDHYICNRSQSWFSRSDSYLATSQDKSLVYISFGIGYSDLEPSVNCYSVADGMMIFRYHHSHLTYPMGLCVDMQDNIYILNSDSYLGIHQVTRDGELVQIFPTGGYNTICFDEKEKELFAAGPLRNEIRRYQLIDREFLKGAVRKYNW